MTCEAQYTLLPATSLLSFDQHSLFEYMCDSTTSGTMIAPLLFFTVVLIFQIVNDQTPVAPPEKKSSEKKQTSQEASENVPPSNNRLGDEVRRVL